MNRNRRCTLTVLPEDGWRNTRRPRHPTWRVAFAASLRRNGARPACEVEERSDLLKRALAEGHELDCHSWDHRAAYPQLDKCGEVFQRVLGLNHFLYRAPGSDKIGGVDLPNLNTFDYTRPGEAEVERRVLLGARRNVVVQMHAGVFDTLAALPTIVGQLQARRFEFRTVAERRRSR